MNTDVDAVVYLMLVNNVLHDLFPNCITIGAGGGFVAWGGGSDREGCVVYVCLGWVGAKRPLPPPTASRSVRRRAGANGCAL